MNNKKYFLNKEQEKYLKKILHKPSKEVEKLFYKKYGKIFSKRQVCYYRNKWNIKGEHTGRFKKGNKPYNIKPIGDISYREDKHNNKAYYYIKTKKGYKKLSRYMYEKYNHKKIPKGYAVISLNKNVNDFSKDNLVIIRNEDLLVAKNRKLLTTDKDLTRLGLLTARLINKTSKLKKQL